MKDTGLKTPSEITAESSVNAGVATAPGPYIKHIFISWLLFSLLFWIAAYNKPFHVDEFFSWIYAERSSFSEIILLKEFGIGHPPLFHLIQKTVQTVLPDYHPLQVRLANYFIGSIFIVTLLKSFSSYRTSPIFFYAVACSAAVLDTFVFSRMWGLVCCMSLMLLLSGESYRSNRCSSRLAVFTGCFVLGILADYNFIVLLPYVLIVLGVKTRRMILTIAGLLITGTAASVLIAAVRGGFSSQTLFAPASSVLHIFHETGLVIFRFWFEEPYLLSLLAVTISMWMIIRRRNTSEAAGKDAKMSSFLFYMPAPLIAIIFDVAVRSDLLRLQYAVVILILVAAMAIIIGRRELSALWESLSNPLTAAIICACMIVLLANIFFWRNLVDTRFLIILLPFFLILLYQKLPAFLSITPSIVLIISGLLYVSSCAVSDEFPPPAPGADKPVVFQNAHSVSNYYLRADPSSSRMFYIIDTSDFSKHCRTCLLKSDKINFDKWEAFRFIGRMNFPPDNMIPAQFALSASLNASHTYIDEIQFRHLRPIPISQYVMHEYRRL